MSQVPGLVSPENSSSPDNESEWQTQLSRKNRQRKREDGRRGSALGVTSGATSLTPQTKLEDSLREEAHQNTVLKKLQDENYIIDFHGCTSHKALEDLKDIIISLTHNMKGTQQDFTVITGKGIHNINGTPKIKSRVLDYLEKNVQVLDYIIEHKIQKKNSGRIDIIVYKK